MYHLHSYTIITNHILIFVFFLCHYLIKTAGYTMILIAVRGALSMSAIFPLAKIYYGQGSITDHDTRPSVCLVVLLLLDFFYITFKYVM